VRKFLKTISSIIREKKLIPVLRDCSHIYKAGIVDIQSYQLNKFNRLWSDIQKNVPYYQDLVRSGAVPTTINSWDNFTKIPVLTRSAIQENDTRFIDLSQKLVGWSTTGGSTGTPFRVPLGSTENNFRMNNAWLGRMFYNIQVSDRLFHFWGHSHLFGHGYRRFSKQLRRLISNWLLGYQVYSAYHLSPGRLRQAGSAILKMHPDYIIGYSRSLLLLAKENEYRADSFKRLDLKALIATTEAFTEDHDAQYIEQVFGCPVAMEYGAAETGVIAYTHPSDQRYRVFWDTFLLEAVPTYQSEAKLLLTTLYPRSMPLIRYDIGDCVRNYDIIGGSIIGFDKVLGRDNDLIAIGGGAFVHPVAVIHCIQYQTGVLGVQIIQQKDYSVSIDIMCQQPLSMDSELAIRKNLTTLAGQLGNSKINYVNQLEQTLAGKTKWVVRR
jgi:phenylacetate-CoA ligase